MKQNVVRLDGNSRDDLEIETNAHTAHALERGLCQKTIVVGFAVPKPTAVAVESYAGNEGKVYAFERKKRWICGFENAKRAGTERFSAKVARNLQCPLPNGREQESFLRLPPLYDRPCRHFVGHIGIEQHNLGC